MPPPKLLLLENLLPVGLLLDPEGVEAPKDDEGLEDGPSLNPGPRLPPVGLTPLVAPLNLTPGAGLMSSCCLPPLPSWPNPRPEPKEAGPAPPKLFPLPALGRELPCLPSSLPSEPKFTKDCRFCFLLPLLLTPDGLKLDPPPRFPPLKSPATLFPAALLLSKAFGRLDSCPKLLLSLLPEENGPFDKVADEKPRGMTEPTWGVLSW